MCSNIHDECSNKSLLCDAKDRSRSSNDGKYDQRYSMHTAYHVLVLLLLLLLLLLSIIIIINSPAPGIIFNFINHIGRCNENTMKQKERKNT